MSRDGNGTVDFPEFLNMVARQMVEDDSSNDLKQAFDLFDENGDGFIRCWAPDMICGLIRSVDVWCSACPSCSRC